LVQGAAKRNIAMPAGSLAPPCPAGLLDGHREPSDQLCEFVEVAGIMVLDGSDEPPQTFVVAQERNFAGHDRRRGLHGVGLGVGHLITFLANPAIGSLRAE
jgi:hypothetical protein